MLPTQVRRPTTPKHAFEDALDEARLTADENLGDFLADALSNPVSQPGVGSLGDITVAAGYVAPASLARAYGAEDAPEERRPAERPADAARKLISGLDATQPTPSELRQLRRRFAADNHPDRVSAEMRAEAVAAMADVNAAIDRALRPSGKPRKAGAT